MLLDAFRLLTRSLALRSIAAPAEVSDYFADFCANLQDIVRSLSFVPASADRMRSGARWQRMQDLYGDSVIPPGLLLILNAGLQDWVHMCLGATAGASSRASGALASSSVAPSPTSAASALASDASAPACARAGLRQEHREDVCDRLLDILRQRILVVDEQPTLTRMFTFREHVDCCLLLCFLGFLADVVKLRGTMPRGRSRKRVAKVLEFFRRPDTLQYLKRTSLALGLTAHVNALVAQKSHSAASAPDTAAAAPRVPSTAAQAAAQAAVSPPVPLLVTLAKGRVASVVEEDLVRVLGKLHLDPDLDVAACSSLLFATASEISMRFEQYERWPYAAWALCKEFNQDGYIQACLSFVEMDQARLDNGFGKPLRQIASRFGSGPLDQVRYLCTDSVQDAISLAFRASAVSSLQVERQFAETKRSEAPRLCHVSTAGRNQILRQHLRQRRDLLQDAEQASALLRRTLRQRLHTLAWEWSPQLASQCLASGGGPALNQYIASHRQALELELEQRVANARALANRENSAVTPLTQQQWLVWFRRNRDDFQRRMDSASAARRQVNARLSAAADVPAPVRHLSAPVTSTPFSKLQRWQQLLFGRIGWFGVKLGPTTTKLFFVYSMHSRTSAVDCSYWREGRAHVFRNFSGAFKSAMGDLAAYEFNEPVQVYDLAVRIVSTAASAPGPATAASAPGLAPAASALGPATAASAPGFAPAASAPGFATAASVSATGACSVTIIGAKLLTEPLPTARRRRTRRPDIDHMGEDNSDSESVGDSSHSEDDLKQNFVSGGMDSSGASSAASVATGAEDEVDEVPAGGGAAADIGQEHSGSEEDAAAGAPDTAAAAPAAAAAALVRHPRGTFKVAEYTWFYITKTSGRLDVKIHMKNPWRQSSTGMGNSQTTKTLTTSHYGDDWENPWRTLLLLRAWSCWRARQAGWVFAEVHRVREHHAELARMEADIRSRSLGAISAPLLGNFACHQLFSTWIPDLANKLLASP